MMQIRLCLRIPSSMTHLLLIPEKNHLVVYQQILWPKPFIDFYIYIYVTI